MLLSHVFSAKLGDAPADGEFMVRMAVDMASVTYKAAPQSSSATSTPPFAASPSSSKQQSQSGTIPNPRPNSCAHSMSSGPALPPTSSPSSKPSSEDEAHTSTTDHKPSPLAVRSPNPKQSSATVGRQAQTPNITTELRKHTVEV
jgi:hypothetical protein